MNVLLKILGWIALVVLVLVAVAFALPRHYRVERSVRIDARVETIYALVGDMRSWRQWGVWFERDQQMTITYQADPSAVGGGVTWQSETQGNGRAEWRRLVVNREAEYLLSFDDFGMQSVGAFALASEDGAVRVTWSDSGDLGLNPINRWFGLFLDKMIGPDFAAGLAKLKRVAESVR